MTKEQQFYLVDFSILPEAIKKTIRVKGNAQKRLFRND